MNSRKRQRVTSKEVAVQTTNPSLKAIPDALAKIIETTNVKRLQSTLIRMCKKFPQAGKSAVKELMVCYEVCTTKMTLVEAEKYIRSLHRRTDRWRDRHNGKVEAGEEDQAEMDRKIDEDDQSLSESNSESDSDADDFGEAEKISIKASEYRELITDDNKIGTSTKFASRFEVCENCGCEFDVTMNKKVCEIHIGERIRKDHEYRGEPAYYTCCPDQDADDAEECKRTYHSVKGALLQAKYC